ncbi:MAG TPA: DNA gyrase inhibitor YacG [Terriglobales bacterium]|nr:DNA gyrase inhibitor YacG [Terriglobales bacterium]
MTRKRVRSLRCPTCRTIVLRSEPEFPFCGERCRLIDLGKWASGRYVISTPVTDPESMENLNAEKSGQQDERDRNQH